MKMRKPSSSLLLLLLASLALADVDQPQDAGARLQRRDGAPSKEEILELNRAAGEPVGRGKVAAVAGADAADGAKPTTSARAYVGTEDAPVDGLDGKPHAGPFVDTTPDDPTTKKKGAAGAGAGADATATGAKARPTSLDKLAQGANGDDGWALADIPEKIDGVMNDENRPVPKKGTTGTEGGVSEKSKEKLAKAGAGENKPQEPKEAPPLPHSEQEAEEHGKAALEGGSGGGSSSSNSKQQSGTAKKEGGKASDKDAKAGESPTKGDDYGAGGLGLEKPADLPEKPHNIPHPEPKGASLPGSGGGSGSSTSKDKEAGPPVDVDKSSWLQDTMPYTEGKTNRAKPESGSSSSSSSSGGNTSPSAADEVAWHEWFHSFVLSLAMILFSEIGDKTFLVAALMAMRHPRLLVFSAAFSALIAMTVLSAVLGHAVPTLLPKRFTTFAAAALFLVFGVRMLREGLAMPKDSGVGEEMKEVEAELEEKEHSLARRASRRRSSLSPYVLESGRGRSASAKLPAIEPSPPSSRSPTPPGGARDRLAGLTNLLSLVLSPAWVQTFIMTFLGEWGDRSQIATIAMAAGQDYWWVTLGAITGHCVCTGIAVLGGRALAGRVSMRVVTIGGALAFIAFGLIYLYECFTGEA